MFLHLAETEQLAQGIPAREALRFYSDAVGGQMVPLLQRPARHFCTRAAGSIVLVAVAHDGRASQFTDGQPFREPQTGNRGAIAATNTPPPSSIKPQGLE